MEGISRKPFQGTVNIIRFNWHFYVIALLLVSALLLAKSFAHQKADILILLGILFITIPILLSLVVSFYVYDYSNLYRLNWLNGLPVSAGMQLVNVHAGFDEASMLLSQKYPASNLTVLDFYNPATHTEISIRRARKAYPPYLGTRAIDTTYISLNANSTDYIFTLLAAHEIRNQKERIAFFKALQQSLKSDGKIIVVEHLRDIPNFMAYTIGFLHFFSKKQWIHTFTSAELCIDKEIKITPFITAFILQKNGTAS